MWKISVVSNDMFLFDFFENICRFRIFEMDGSPLEKFNFQYKREIIERGSAGDR